MSRYIVLDDVKYFFSPLDSQILKSPLFPEEADSDLDITDLEMVIFFYIGSVTWVLTFSLFQHNIKFLDLKTLTRRVAFILMYAKTDDIFTLTIIHTPLPAYPLHIVGTISRKTHFYTFRQVHECK